MTWQPCWRLYWGGGGPLVQQTCSRQNDGLGGTFPIQ